MSNRITKADIKVRFARVCEVMGWSQYCWESIEVDGIKINRAKIGAVYLDHAAIYGGYAVNQIVNEAGAIRQLTGTWTRLKPPALMAWMDGILLAKGAV